MNNNNIIYDIFPINYNNYELKLLTFELVDEYCNILVSDYYTEFMDDMKCDISLINEYAESMKELCWCYYKRHSMKKFRFVLVNNKHIIGGMTVSFCNETDIEISYFVNKNMSGQHIASNMLRKALTLIDNSAIQFDRYIAIIREDNIKSINLVKSIGFKEKEKYLGKVRYNLVMELNRYEIK